MGRQRLAWVSGPLVVLILLLIAGGMLLKRHYCWGCTAGERYAVGIDLLCAQDREARARGLKFVVKAADQGLADARILAGELLLQPLPKRFVPLQPERLACAAAGVKADSKRALGYFKSLIVDGQLTPKLQYDLGVLIEAGVLENPVAGKTVEDYFRSAAKQGDPRALYEMGMAEDQKKDYAAAATLFKEAFSRGGHPGAALMLGNYAYFGRFEKGDLENAMVWYQKALAAARSSEYAADGFTQPVEQRISIVEEFRRRAGSKAVTSVSYRLGGGLSEYRVYAGDSNDLLGRVERQDGQVVATYLAGGEGGENAETKDVASMNDGLDWILETYAAGRYGADQKFKFVLLAD